MTSPGGGSGNGGTTGPGRGPLPVSPCLRPRRIGWLRFHVALTAMWLADHRPARFR